MRIETGRYAGKTTQLVLFKRPDWVQWLLRNYPDNKLVPDFKLLIEIFDSKPLLKACYCCARQATCASVPRGTGWGMHFWCDDCNPYSTGARCGSLGVVSTFESAMVHADWTCEARRRAKRDLIKELAQAKGLPARVGAPPAAAFFEPDR
jgi:hypothetical protein